MSKKKKHKKVRHNRPQIDPDSPPVVWQDEKGNIHALAPGNAPTQNQLDEMSRIYQEQIKKSPWWKHVVRIFGQAKAEELLKQCRAELKHG